MAVYQSSYNDYNKSVAAKDLQGVNELAGRRDLLLVPIEFKARILEVSDSYFQMHVESTVTTGHADWDRSLKEQAAGCLIRVRILDGTYKDKTGWLPAWKLLPVE
jgi:hypothetical protein